MDSNPRALSGIAGVACVLCMESENRDIVADKCHVSTKKVANEPISDQNRIQAQRHLKGAPEIPNGAPKAPKGTPRKPKRTPKGSRMTPRRKPQTPKGP